MATEPQTLEKKLIESTNPDYDPARITLAEDLYYGGKRFDANIKDQGQRVGYIPKGPLEKDKAYENRLRFTFYVNYCSQIINTMTSIIFRKSNEMHISTDNSDNLPDNLQALVADADGQHKHLADVVKDALTKALLCERGYILVDLPRRVEGAESIADEEAAGTLRPLARSIDPIQVKDWSYGVDQALDWVLIEYEESTRPRPTDERVEKKYWLVYTREEWAKYEEVKGGARGSETAIVMTAQGPHSFGQVPLVVLKLPADYCVMDRIRSPLLALFRIQNDLANALRKNAHEVPVFKLMDTNQSPVVGDGMAIMLSAPDNEDMKWSGPSGQANNMIAQFIDFLKNELYRIVNQLALAANVTPGAALQSGESKMRDFLPLQLLCEALAKYAKTALLEVLRLAGRGVGIEKEFSISGAFDDYAVDDVKYVLESMQLASTVGLEWESPTFKKHMHNRIASAMLSGVDPGTRTIIENEIAKAVDKQAKEDSRPPTEPPPVVPDEEGEEGAEGEEQDTGKGGFPFKAKKAEVEE